MDGITQATLDGFEPRMFPGIVNRRRTMSVVQGFGDGEGQTKTNHASSQTSDLDRGFNAVEEEEEESDLAEA
jgi:hypothetical protein